MQQKKCTNEQKILTISDKIFTINKRKIAKITYKDVPIKCTDHAQQVQKCKLKYAEKRVPKSKNTHPLC